MLIFTVSRMFGRKKFKHFALSRKFMRETAATDAINLVKNKYCRSLNHKNGSTGYDNQSSSQNTEFVKGGRIPLLSLNELGGKLQATVILVIFPHKP